MIVSQIAPLQFFLTIHALKHCHVMWHIQKSEMASLESKYFSNEKWLLWLTYCCQKPTSFSFPINEWKLEILLLDFLVSPTGHVGVSVQYQVWPLMRFLRSFFPFCWDKIFSLYGPLFGTTTILFHSFHWILSDGRLYWDAERCPSLTNSNLSNWHRQLQWNKGVANKDIVVRLQRLSSRTAFKASRRKLC